MAEKNEPTPAETPAPEVEKIGLVTKLTTRFPRATRAFAITGVVATAVGAALVVKNVKSSGDSTDDASDSGEAQYYLSTPDDLTASEA